MNYSQTLDYLYSQLPMFHRIGAAAYKADLNNTIAICKLLGNPHNKFKSIHIAGTNGKGSVSHSLAAILQTAGYKTGLYTSPHLKDFRERIRINGKMIPEKNVIAFVKKYSTQFEKIKPSFFEWTVGLAFNFFAEENVDIAVIETGLGGRLDSTNVITPVLSIITNISFDHKELLGKTLKKIAAEKAGIIKSNVPVVIGEKNPLTQKVFEQKAALMKSKIAFASEKYFITNSIVSNNTQIISVIAGKKKKDFKLDLTGIYQQKNLHTILTSIDKLRKKKFRISDSDLADGLQNVKSKTGLRGRWEVLNSAPLTIADVGHNEAGIRITLSQIRSLKKDKVHFVFGMVSDKDRIKILKLLPKNFTYYFCKPDLPRGLDEKILLSDAKNFGLTGKKFSSVNLAYEAAKKNASVKDLIFIGGSTFVVAEVL